MPTVYLGIGSNLGSRRENCLRAIGLLEGRGLKITKRSSLHKTEPWGLKEQPEFINMALEVETELQPAELLTVLKQVERDMGRERSVKWGPRIIDLDILLYDDLIITGGDLTVPHPLMHERAFVLVPLAEIAPSKVHPVFLKKISDLLLDLKRQRSR